MRLLTQLLIVAWLAVWLAACHGPATGSTDQPAVTRIGPGEGRVVLVISPHADDATLFIGGTVAAWAEAGWRVVVIRVTDDRWDSVALTEAETIRRSHQEFEHAMQILGASATEHLGYQTDVLGDVSRVELRGRLIRLIRLHRPYALVSVDPHAGTGEDNLDHFVVGQAAAEAVWTAQFDKHHAEDLAAGLEPHGVVEQWYYGRPPGEVTDIVDISTTLARKVDAALAHDTPLRNIVHQLQLQARTAGYRVPALDEATSGSLRPLIESMIAEPARALGREYGIGAAEAFRVERFGGMMDWLKANGVPLETEANGQLPHSAHIAQPSEPSPAIPAPASR